MRGVIKICSLLLWSASLCALSVPCFAGQRHARTARVGERARQRGFTVEDLFRFRDIGDFEGGPYAYSRFGGALAITLLRPIATDPSQKWKELQSSELQSNARGDVWVQAAMGQPLRNVTHGSTDGSGWFSPQWSPDGMRLAMLSTRGGLLRLWTWNRVTGNLKPVVNDQVTFSLQQHTIVHDQPYVWMDSRHIIFTALPEEKSGRGSSAVYEYMRSKTPALASAAWQQYLSGTKSTASALGEVTTRDRSSGARLIVTDLAGDERVLARNVDTLLWQPNPKAEAVAFTREVRFRLTLGEHLQDMLTEVGDWKVEVVATDGRRLALADASAVDVLPASLRWSPTGETLAYLGYANRSQAAPSVYLLDIRTGDRRAVALTDFDASPAGRDLYDPLALSWTGGGDLLIRGVRQTAPGDVVRDRDTREDWWLVSPHGAQRCVTCRLPEAPQLLWAENGETRFFGLANGNLWQFDVERRTADDLTGKFGRHVDSLISPPSSFTSLYFVETNRTLEPNTYTTTAFLAMHGGGVPKPYLMDIRSHAIRRLMPPTQTAKLVSVGPGGGSFLYVQEDGGGLLLWRQDARTGTSRLLFSGNGFLRAVSKAGLVHFPYTSDDGRELNAWLLLPLGYRSGRRYPTIVFVYPTDSYSASGIPRKIESYTALSSDSVFNMQIAAAHGYAVLFPSVPVAYRDRGEVRIRLVNEVLPAVAAAVLRGYADPDRLAVWGVSYGGEAVFDLITATDRFKAGIASSGLSDLISAYGDLDAEYRYDDRAGEHVFEESLSEHGELNLGGPPWKNWSNYIDNSPIFSVGRIHTPLLMTDGDLDFVPMQQSEEIYRALVQQNKSVRFVRYWGEGHLLTNPANIRDYWEEMFEWLQRFLTPGRRQKRALALQ